MRETKAFSAKENMIIEDLGRELVCRSILLTAKQIKQGLVLDITDIVWQFPQYAIIHTSAPTSSSLRVRTLGTRLHDPFQRPPMKSLLPPFPDLAKGRPLALGERATTAGWMSIKPIPFASASRFTIGRWLLLFPAGTDLVLSARAMDSGMGSGVARVRLPVRQRQKNW